MDINQLKTWADVADKVGAISLLVAGLAVVVLGVSTWLSIKYNSRLISDERATITRFKTEVGEYARQLEAKIATLEQSGGRTDQQTTEAAQRAAALERQVVLEKERNALLEGRAAEAERKTDQAQQKTAEAAERATRLEKQVALEKERSALLEGLVAEAERKAEPAKPQQAPEAAPSSGESNAPPSEEPTAQLAAKLARYAGAAAAVYALEESPVAANVASLINASLTKAGLSSSVWQWKGVGGIEGIVVLTKEGRDGATDAVAAGIVEVLRASGYNISKANWPADWRRYRGTLTGPQVPDPTDAPIRIVVGANTGPQEQRR